MKRKIISISLLLISIITFSQVDKDFYWFDLKGNYVFIDNSKYCWYTINIPADTFVHVNKTMFFFDNKDLQVNNSFVKLPENDYGALNNTKREIDFLKGKRKWELDYQRKVHKKRLKSKKILYNSKNGKPFLIWWFKSPKESDIPLTSYEIDLGETQNTEDSTGIVELEVTHSLFLEFIVKRSNSVSLSFSVYENETLDQNIELAKEMANSLNSYSSFIDIDLLEKKYLFPESYFFQDSLKKIQVKFPDGINVLDRYYNNSFLVSFPEKRNVYNAASVKWEYKDGKKEFESFIEERRIIAKVPNDSEVISKSDSTVREKYVKDNYFIMQNVYMEGDSIFCFINFTATKDTYDFNVDLFNKLVQSVELK